MATTIRKKDYFKVGVADKPGEAARLLGALRDKGVNLLALTGFPRGRRRAQIDFVPENTAAFKRALKQAGVDAGEKKTVFLVQGDDKVGAMAEILEKLGKAGINVTTVDAASDGKGRFAALLWVKAEDVSKSSKLLGAS
ncbi:MAG: ACT domain-containing protein [bacterium]